MTSKVGAGTTIDMILPSTPQPSLKSTKERRKHGSSSVRSILLVDDDDAVRTVVGEQLRELGFEVVATADVAGAISAIDGGVACDLLTGNILVVPVAGIEPATFGLQNRCSTI